MLPNTEGSDTICGGSEVSSYLFTFGSALTTDLPGVESLFRLGFSLSCHEARKADQSKHNSIPTQFFPP